MHQAGERLREHGPPQRHEINLLRVELRAEAVELQHPLVFAQDLWRFDGQLLPTRGEKLNLHPNSFDTRNGCQLLLDLGDDGHAHEARRTGFG